MSHDLCDACQQSGQARILLVPSLALTPRGHLLLTGGDDTTEPPAAFWRRLEGAFARGSGHGLLELGAGEVGTALPADVGYWRDFAARFVTSICTHPDLDADRRQYPRPLSASSRPSPPPRRR